RLLRPGPLRRSRKCVHGTGPASHNREGVRGSVEGGAGRRQQHGGKASGNDREGAAMPRLAIETEDLVKVFGDNRAVDGVDLRIPTGGVYGVLGPNGAGKTTTIRMLATLLVPDGGRAEVLGYDVAHQAAEVRSRVAMTGQFASLDEDLTGLENLVLLARLYGYGRAAAKERARELLAAFDLSDAASRQVKAYSGGMRRRIDIAGSLVVRPELMFLDEPTT